MKKICSLFFAMLLCMPVVARGEDGGDVAQSTDADAAITVTEPVAADTANPVVAARKSCADMKAEIDKVTADGGDAAALQTAYRAQCSVRSSARRARSVEYAASVTTPIKTVVTDTQNTDTATDLDAVIENLVADTSEKCAELKKQIDDLDATSDSSKKSQIPALRTQYARICNGINDVPPADDATAEPDTTDAPTLTPEQINANLDAGLCGDGTRPNKYGCCTGEIFKDMGKDGFNCCPKSGDGLCYPPIKK